MLATTTYDVVIIGGGLGGLLCGAMLSKEGMRVCILEKNEQIGGSLQTFRRDGLSLDTGIHYIGGLDKGENLYQIFNYLGLMDRLEIEKMEEDGFDVILFKDDETQYRHGIGYNNFIDLLSAKFPNERENIKSYCDKVKQTCQSVALYNLCVEDKYDDIDMLSLSAKDVIESFTQDIKLGAVLAGSNMLYAGDTARTPWNVHALIVNSYIESSWRCTAGGDQIAKLLAREIKANNGTIQTKVEVASIHEENGEAVYLKLVDGTNIQGKKFISNVHPSLTLDMIDSDAIRPVYKKRIQNLPNSISAFVLNIILKPNTYKYTNRNYYYFNDLNVWDTGNYTEDNWPLTYGIFEAVPHHGLLFTESLSIMTYMRWDEVSEWQQTENTSIHEESRGEAYEHFKKRKARKLLNTVAIKFPDLVKNIETWYASTPLTYKDYLATPDGSIYGIAKDFNNPIRTQISPNTKIPNLYLTGQNIKLHGVLGVALTAVVTCSSILGREYLVNKIIKANEVVS
jgi:all-trans-retinol 13,14-reductase